MDHMASAGDVEETGKSRIPGFAKIIILVQTVLNLFLSQWIYQEYLSNPYLQVYINDSVQTIGWAIAVITVIIVLGALTTILFRWKKNMPEKIEVAPTLPKVAPAPPTSKPKPAETFHPAVASLKAELSHRPLLIGELPISKTEEATEGRAQPTVVTSPTAPNIPPSTIVTGPTAGTTSVVKKREPEKPAEEKSSSKYEDKSSSQ